MAPSLFKMASSCPYFGFPRHKLRSQLLSSKPRQHAVGPSARTRCFKSQPLSQEWGCLCPHPRRDRGADPFQGSSAPPCPPRWGSHRNPLSGVGLCDQEGVPAQAPRIGPKRPPARAGRPRKAPAHIRSPFWPLLGPILGHLGSNLRPS